MIFGWLADRIKAWKLMLGHLTIMVLLTSLYIYFMQHNGIGLIIGFAGMTILNHNINMLVISSFFLIVVGVNYT